MPRVLRIFFYLALLGCSPQGSALGQIKNAQGDTYLRFGEVQVSRYRVGASITAKRGAVRNVLATVAVPLTCPEQEVELVEEDITSQVRSHEYRVLPGEGAKQMIIRVPRLPNKEEAHAILTFEVRTRTILPPEDTSELTIPKKPSRDLKIYLGKSPLIETKHSKLKKLSREIFQKLEAATDDRSENNADTADADTDGADSDGADIDEDDSSEASTADANNDTSDDADDDLTSGAAQLTDWQRVEAIYDYVQETITYQEQDDKSALATLKDGHGDCQNISALFVALCRTSGIPARIVWVHEHNYPEFCLADPEGEPHWFPCESSGTRAFGEMPLARVIMQKGDNFKVPERRKALRYVSDYMIGLPAGPGGGPPSHKFIRERL